MLQLDARELEVDEQAAFAAASWKELQSFFESSVWQVCHEAIKSER